MLNKHKKLYINIWNGCNLNCKHCFNERGKVQKRLLTYSEIILLVEDAKENIGIEEIQISGGEPTQRPDFFVIIKELQRKGLRILLQSNGVYDSPIIKEILKLPEEKLSLIVSLDGIETNDYFRGQGATQKIIDNIKILSKKFQIRINTLLSSKITLEEIVRLTRKPHG